MKHLQFLRKIFTLSAFAALLCFLSCNEDKGNYIYMDVNVLDSINNINASYSVDVGDLLEIKPMLVFSSGNNGEDFTYTWYYKVDNKYIALQEGLNFSHEIAPPIGKSVTMAFVAFNEQSGVYYRKIFNLVVGNPKGYAALCDLDNSFDIDMVVYSPSKNTFSLSKNMLAESELPREGVKPIGIMTVTGTITENLSPTPAYPDGTKYTVWILTDKYTTRVSSKDFSWAPEYKIEASVESGSYLDVHYVQAGKPIIAKKMKANDTQGFKTWMYMDDDGEQNWFVYQLNAPYRFLGNPINVSSKKEDKGDMADITTRYNVSPHSYAYSAYGALFYDQANKNFKFAQVNNQNSTTWYGFYYCVPLATETTQGQFSFSDPQFEDIYYMGESLYDGVALMKLRNNAGYRFIQFTGGRSPVEIVTNRKRTSLFPAGSAIKDMKFFAAYPDYPGNPYIYYVTNDNKVWCADVSSTTAVETEITQAFVKGGYTEITAFKFLWPQSVSSADCPASLEKGLAVATYDASKGKTTGGKLEIFTLLSQLTGEMEVAKHPTDKDLKDNEEQITMSFEGMGKISGLDYKKK